MKIPSVGRKLNKRQPESPKSIVIENIVDNLFTTSIFQFEPVTICTEDFGKFFEYCLWVITLFICNITKNALGNTISSICIQIIIVAI